MDGAKIIHYLVELMHVNRKKSVRNMQYEFYFGSEYWALSYEILQVLIQKWDRDIKLQKFLKWAFAPSEIWIHTLFFNSKYRDKGTEFTGEYKGIFELSPLSFFKYNKKIEVLTEKDYSDILLSKKCFARKIIVGKSDSLINLIEKGR